MPANNQVNRTCRKRQAGYLGRSASQGALEQSCIGIQTPAREMFEHALGDDIARLIEENNNLRSHRDELMAQQHGG